MLGEEQALLAKASECRVDVFIGHGFSLHTRLLIDEALDEFFPASNCDDRGLSNSGEEGVVTVSQVLLVRFLGQFGDLGLALLHDCLEHLPNKFVEPLAAPEVPRGRGVLFHPWLHFLFFVMLLDDALIVILVQHLYIILCFNFCKLQQVLGLVGVGVYDIQLVGKQVNIVQKVLCFLFAVVEGDGEGRPKMLHHLSPVDISLGVSSNADLATFASCKLVVYFDHVVA